jgi:hypothetical protein
MARNLEIHRMETGGGMKGSRRDAASRIWERLKDKLAIGAFVLVAGCAPAASQNQPTTPPVPEAVQPTAVVSSTTLQSGRTSAGQTEIGMQRRIDGGTSILTYTANVTGDNMTYNWFMYQDAGTGNQLLLNPRYRETSQPRYVGAVVRDATLTDGTRGDFVVRVYGNATAPASDSEFSPVVERDGRVRPENVLYALQNGSLEPVRDSRLQQNLDECCMARASPMVSVVEYAATTAVLIVTQKMAAATGPISNSSSQMAPRE